MLSPSFVIVNAFRDMMTAQVNLGESGGDIRGKLRKRAVLDWAKSARGAYKGMKGETDSEYSKWFKEYSEVGGKIAFFQMEDAAVQSADIAKRVKRESRGLLGKVQNLGIPNTRDNPALAWIERINLSVDNAARLATYVEARKQGWSKEDAASLARNMTTNFNRRGEAGAVMNAWFPFANAAIQGTHVIAKAATNRQVQGIIGGMFAFGLANDLLNAALSEEDDDGELQYDQIPPYVAERNIILATGSITGSPESYTTIPLAYGYNFPFFAGQQLGKILRGVKDPKESAGQLFSAGVGAFSPLSGETAQDFFMPTLIDFANELSQNKDWLGRPIRPEPPYADYGPQSYREYNPTNLSRLIARGLNDSTGGSPLESGLIDISPEYFDHVAKFLGGGAGRFLLRTTNLVESAFDGTMPDVTMRDIPLARVVSYRSGDFLNQSRYFEFRDAVKEARWAEKQAKATGAPVTKEIKALVSLWEDLKDAEKDRGDIEDDLDAVYADNRLNNARRAAKLRPLRRDRNETYVKFNRKFIEKMGRQAE